MVLERSLLGLLAVVLLIVLAVCFTSPARTYWCRGIITTPLSTSVPVCPDYPGLKHMPEGYK